MNSNKPIQLYSIQLQDHIDRLFKESKNHLSDNKLKNLVTLSNFIKKFDIRPSYLIIDSVFTKDHEEYLEDPEYAVHFKNIEKIVIPREGRTEFQLYADCPHELLLEIFPE